jgi:predicted MFS family arabinose efflux permease
MLNIVRQRLFADGLLARADFRRYWASSIASSFGGQVGALAMPLCAALMLQATPAQMGILGAWQALPFAVLALPAGVWLDRSRKLPILLGSKILQATALASIPLAWWMGALSMHWLYAVGVILGACSVVGGAAEQMILTFMVGRDRLIDAHSKFTLTDSLARVTGPGLAGLLVQALTAPFALLVDAIGILLSGWLLGGTKVNEPAPTPLDQHPLADVHDGLRFIWQTPLLRMLIITVGAWHVFLYATNALQIVFATRVLGMSPGVLGAANMIGGLGAFASSFLIKPMSDRFGAGKTILIGLWGTTISFLLIPLIPGHLSATPILYGLAIFAYDCGLFIFLLPYVALRQKVTPDAMLGRMISTSRFLTVGSAPLGALAGGYLGEAIGIREAMLSVAAASALLCITMTANRTIRSVRP